MLTIIKRKLTILSTLLLTVVLFLLFFQYQELPQLQSIGHYDVQSPEMLHEFTTKFLLVKWWAWLGFNNVRYELERHIYHALITNRTVVIPSFMHLRQCLDIGACKLKGRKYHVKISDSNEWALPIEYFYDLAHLKKHVRVVTISDFVSMQRERQWSNDAKIEPSMIREDFDTLMEYTMDPSHFKKLLPDMTYQKVDIRHLVIEAPKGHIIVDNTEPVEQLFNSSVTAVPYTLYGFPCHLPHMAIDQNFSISVTVLPPNEWRGEDDTFDMSESRTAGFSTGKYTHRTYNVPSYRSPVRLTGFAQQFNPQYTDNIYARAVLLYMDSDEHFHEYYILKHTTPEGAKQYEDVVFNFLKYAPEIYDAAEHVLQNLTEKLEGRPFLSIHIRRGDFVKLHWLDEFEREDVLLQTVGNVVTELNQWYSRLNGSVLTEDPYSKRLSTSFLYITDEAVGSPLIDKLNNMGGIRIEDIMLNDVTFTERFRDRACFGDWLAVVGQIVCANAWHFVGSLRSSVSGGILNLRKAQGYKEESSTFLDEYYN